MLVETKQALDQNADLLKSIDQQLLELIGDEQLDHDAQGKIRILHNWLSDKRSELETQENARSTQPDQDERTKARRQKDKARLFAKKPPPARHLPQCADHPQRSRIPH